jgi:hypothetical protein
MVHVKRGLIPMLYSNPEKFLTEIKSSLDTFSDITFDSLTGEQVDKINGLFKNNHEYNLVTNRPLRSNLTGSKIDLYQVIIRRSD